MAQSKTSPKYIAFHCKTPASTGGETPLIDSSIVYSYLHNQYPEIEKKLQTYGVRYKRVLPPEDDLASPLGRSWKNTYDVDNESELEEKLAVIPGIQWKWLEDGNLEVITEILPAIKYIASTKYNVFFNSIIAAYKGWDDARNVAADAVMYGNGAKIPANALEDISSFMESNKTAWKWEAGDVIWIDNDLVMHSRNTFAGSREIHASLWNGREAPTSNQLPIAFGEEKQ